MTDQSDQINPNATIFAITRGGFGTARVNIGTPYETAVAYPDALSFYTADNDSGTFIRLAHVVTGRRGEESHQWYYNEATWSPKDYVEPKNRTSDPLAVLPDLGIGDPGESFFGALKDEMDAEREEVSRGNVFATAVVAVHTERIDSE